MKYERLQALMSLATEQGVELKTVRELKLFAINNRAIISKTEG